MANKYIFATLFIIATLTAKAELPAGFYHYSETPIVPPYEMKELTEGWEEGYKPKGWSAFSLNMNPRITWAMPDFRFEADAKIVELDYAKVDTSIMGSIYVTALISPPIVIPESGILRMSFEVATDGLTGNETADVSFALRPYDEANAQTSQNSRFSITDLATMWNTRYWRESITNSCGEFVKFDIEVFKTYPPKVVMQSGNLTDYRYKSGEKACLVLYHRAGKKTTNFHGVLRYRNIKLYPGNGNEPME